MGLTAAILGTTGYTGMVLLRLLEQHPEVDKILPGSSSRAGEPISVSDPGFGQSGKCAEEGHRFLSTDEIRAKSPDVVFSCLPHLASISLCAPFIGKSVVIDLSADLRIPDAGIFTAAYKEPPPAPELIGKSVYGLTELFRSQVKTADIISVPGCYPTATLLPLIPAIRQFKTSGPVIVNAMSGISGAGKKAKENLLLAERTENACAYAPGSTHRHYQEIFYYMSRFSKEENQTELLFTPHLIPMKRGMEVTTVVQLAAPIQNDDIAGVYNDTYGSSPFFRIKSEGFPETREVRGSNSCLMSWRIENNMLMLFSVIDNLVKGASGQAVQNMNIRFGFEETAGLTIFGEV